MPNSASDPAASDAPAAASASGLELRARVLSSLVLAPLALAVTWTLEPIFAGVVAGGGVILAREWTRMSDPDGPDLAFALAAGGAAGAAIAASAGYIELALIWAGAVAALAGMAAWPRGRAMDAAFGVIYVAVPCALLVWMRLEPSPVGSQLVTFLFAAVWGADIGAFIAGKVFGGPKLAPRISPGKTWAGLVGGAVLAIGFGLTAGVATGLSASREWESLVALALALGLAGLAGDLLESALKRRYGVKDSGSLIPGHGGLMDRVDGLMVAAVCFAVWIALWGGA